MNKKELEKEKKVINIVTIWTALWADHDWNLVKKVLSWYLWLLSILWQEWIKEGFTIVKGSEKNTKDKKKAEEVKSAEEAERKRLFHVHLEIISI